MTRLLRMDLSPSEPRLPEHDPKEGEFVQIGDWGFICSPNSSWENPANLSVSNEMTFYLVEMAVRSVILDLMKQDGPSDWQIQGAYRHYREAVSSHPSAQENFNFGGPGAKEVFVALSECLAIMAFIAPGGVRFGPQHYEVYHWGDSCRARGASGKDHFYSASFPCWPTDGPQDGRSAGPGGADG